ncbi:MAG: glycosyltransferase [Gemmatimonadota bacterium]|nr:glycosyltransferase [Gemmatimonadota bacterium]
MGRRFRGRRIVARGGRIRQGGGPAGQGLEPYPKPTAAPRVLVLSAGAGTGHLRAGEALADAVRRHAPEAAVRHVDALDLAPRWVSACYGDGFELLAGRAPAVWRGLYRVTDGPDPGDSRVWAAAERTLFRRFRRLLRSRPWDVILATHFLPCQLVRGARRAGLPPIHLVVTDFTLHRYWVQPAATRLHVATEALARRSRLRLPATPVSVSGIPVASRFAAVPDRAAARRAFGLDPSRPVLLAVAGGMGLRVERAVRAALAARVPGLQVLVVCGRNESARARLAALGRPDLVVRGYEERMEAAIATADLVLTKPGGLTVAETLAVGRPLLLSRPIPGHEEANAALLVREGAAVFPGSDRELPRAVEALFAVGGPLAELEAAAGRLGRPGAAAAIVTEALAPLGSVAAA